MDSWEAAMADFERKDVEKKLRAEETEAPKSSPRTSILSKSSDPVVEKMKEVMDLRAQELEKRIKAAETLLNCLAADISDIRDQRYRTELDIGTSDIGLKRAESDIISDIGIKLYSISDIQCF
jgi:hypothetical protein